jgi:hypothetical protein
MNRHRKGSAGVITINEVLRRSDDALEGLTQRQVDLARYAFTIEYVHQVNVSDDPTFQRTFNAVYGVRRNEEWRRHFYQIFEQEKSNPAPKFGEVVGEIFNRTGRVEASFASKLIATLDPNQAVYDSVVLSNFGFRPLTSTGVEKIADVVRDYGAIQSHLEALAGTDVFAGLRQRFDRQFPQFEAFTDLKVLDLLIWQMR